MASWVCNGSQEKGKREKEKGERKTRGKVKQGAKEKRKTWNMYKEKREPHMCL